MAYEHRLVSKLRENPNTPDQPDVSSFYLDKICVTREVYHFGTQLRRSTAFRGCKFGTTSPSITAPDYAHSTVTVYFPNQIYTLGDIGYRDCSVGDSTRWAYYIISREVSNKKYHQSRKEYNMVLSKDVNKAVVNARKYLRPYTTADIASVTVPFFGSSLGTAQHRYGHDSRIAYVNLVEACKSPQGCVAQELLLLYNSGYVFKTDLAQKLIEDVVGADAALDSARNELSHRLSLVFVDKLLTPNAEPNVVVVSGPPQGVNVMSNTWALEGAFKDKQRVSEAATTYRMSELPEDIMGKLALLNMIQDDSFVEGVGYRFNESIFYVLN